ncbi:MAG: SPOR domain-containing protein, partial [Flammeovirgaceae bacterium]|nr:SPOR domain-containing protein [Flammeovirgaceae bacterium]MDW8287749.1 SPOR domain-containing protein [Flammeovirgaceae bacterium]
MIRLLNFSIGWFILLTMSGCSPQEVSQEKPYSIIAGRFRNLQTAQNMAERLQEKGVDAYLLGYNTTNEGKWYWLMLGASNRLDDITAYKIECEDVHRLNDLELTNYNKFKNHLFDWKTDLEKYKSLATEKPALDEKIWQLLKKLPYHPHLALKRLAIYHAAVQPNILEMAFMDEEMPDIPRGMLPSQLLALSDVLIEASYIDPLEKKEFLLHYLALKHPDGTKLIEQYAKNILSTKRFDKKEKTEATLDDYHGWIVSLSEESKLFKRYFLLTNPTHQEIILLQTSTNQLQDFHFLVSQIDNTDEILTYKALYNHLYLLSAEADSTDALLFFKVEQNRDLYGKYAAHFYGQYKSKTLRKYRRALYASEITSLNDATIAQKIWQ